MSKKSRNYKSKRRRANMTKIQQDSLPPSSTLTSVSKQQATGNNTSQVQSPNNHYQYLIPELRRIGILSGVIVLVLIVLSFILG